MVVKLEPLRFELGAVYDGVVRQAPSSLVPTNMHVSFISRETGRSPPSHCARSLASWYLTSISLTTMISERAVRELGFAEDAGAS